MARLTFHLPRSSARSILFMYIGVSYFVYGEKFDTLMTKQKEFIEAAMDFIDTFTGIVISSTLSTSSNFLTRLFPPLPYRKYMSTLKKVQQLGMLSICAN